MAAERRRLTGLDTAFLSLERAVTPMQLGSLAVFRSDRPMRAEAVARLLADRARRLPRLGRRVQPAWFPPGTATWAEDPGFIPEEHIRLHQLDAPAGTGQAAELAAELMAQPLRRDRPLWELHVMAGLDDDRFAVLTKLHHALGDGLAALEIGIGMLDAVTPAGASAAERNGRPRAVARAVASQSRKMSRGRKLTPRRILSRPFQLANGVRTAAGGAVGQAAEMVGMAASVLGSARLPSPGSPLVVMSSGRRGLGLARLDLQQVRRIRAHFGGTVNDVLLAVVAGALRDWFSGRGHEVDGLRLRALIPVSRRARSGRRSGGNELSGYLCELPVDEPDPSRRLRAIQAAMLQSKAAGTTRGPGAIPLLAARLPPALHRVVAPVAGQVASLLFDILVTSVPMPGTSLRLGGAELTEVFPIAPLAPGH
ncbi:MAG TPA: wax ester/triacylglycerol synthase family O-acyltransferase, partial [Pseudonocardiaceae bacterium]|nr:wax ester/triacylglycerol synthase family O-acyltransferase [Pseudonocardiaceae bacterium]